jgi:hypothetical protein
MKLAKLSLAAIIAAGAFSVANATPLENAIKGVDLSGMMRLRFYNEDRGSQNTAPDYNRWRSSADFKFTVPVSDTFKFIYQLSVEGNSRSNGNVATQNNQGVSTETQAYLNYSSNGLNVIAGRIPVQTTITTAGHGENTGDGVIATYGLGGGFTVAGFFIDALRGGSVVTGGADIAGLAGIYSNDMVSANAWYYRITNVAKSIFTVSATVKPVAGFTIGGDYAAGKLTDATSVTLYGHTADTHSFWNVFAGYAANGFDAKVGYAATNKKDGIVYQNADSHFGDFIPAIGQRYGLANDTDMDVFYGKVGYKVSGATNVYAAYATVDEPGKANDSDEYIAGVKYKYNKKLSFHAYYDVLDYNSAGNSKDNNEFRFEAKYSF